MLAKDGRWVEEEPLFLFDVMLIRLGGICVEMMEWYVCRRVRVLLRNVVVNFIFYFSRHGGCVVNF